MLNTPGYQTYFGALLTVCSVALVIAILLWRGKKLEQKRQRALMRAGFTSRSNQPVEPEPDEPPFERPDLRESQEKVSRLLSRCQRLSETHDYKGVAKFARQALSVALPKIGGDHWLTGHCLDWLAYAEMGQGYYYDALMHLEAAAAILSEWSDQDNYLKTNLLPRVATCRTRLGFENQ